jgi:hypothetical protein
MLVAGGLTLGLGLAVDALLRGLAGVTLLP